MYHAHAPSLQSSPAYFTLFTAWYRPSHNLRLMKRHTCDIVRSVLLLVILFLQLAVFSGGVRPAPTGENVVSGEDKTPATSKGSDTGDGLPAEEAYATGSSLPDCSHACGACSPCNRVMVSFKCSVAEPCPMVYRCMCKGKCYPIPSS